MLIDGCQVAVFDGAVVLKVGFPDQQHGPHLGTCWKCQFLGFTPRPLESEAGGEGPAHLVAASPSGDSATLAGAWSLSPGSALAGSVTLGKLPMAFAEAGFSHLTHKDCNTSLSTLV